MQACMAACSSSVQKMMQNRNSFKQPGVRTAGSVCLVLVVLWWTLLHEGLTSDTAIFRDRSCQGTSQWRTPNARVAQDDRAALRYAWELRHFAPKIQSLSNSLPTLDSLSLEELSMPSLCASYDPYFVIALHVSSSSRGLTAMQLMMSLSSKRHFCFLLMGSANPLSAKVPLCGREAWMTDFDLSHRCLTLVSELFPSAEWVAKVDDDGLLFIDAVEEMLMLHSLRSQAGGQYIGYPMPYDEANLLFASGGASYYLNRKAMEVYAKFDKSAPGFKTPLHTGEDVSLGLIMRHHGIQFEGLYGIHSWNPDLLLGRASDELPQAPRVEPSVLAVLPLLSFHYIKEEWQRIVEAWYTIPDGFVVIDRTFELLFLQKYYEHVAKHEGTVGAPNAILDLLNRVEALYRFGGWISLKKDTSSLASIPHTSGLAFECIVTDSLIGCSQKSRTMYLLLHSLITGSLRLSPSDDPASLLLRFAAQFSEARVAFVPHV